MGNYVERGCQTEIKGLCKDPASFPQQLKSPHAPNDTPTPPDDMVFDNSPFTTKDTSSNHHHQQTNTNLQPSMFLKRKNRPTMVARISLPASGFDEDPRSPPPTEALMSPLPAANRLHAGHTPIIPRAMSPLPPSEGPASPADDDGLSGPLTLPPQPGDGTEDTIPLHVLDQELEKLRLAQESTREHDFELARSDSATEADPEHEDDATSLTRSSSKDSQKHSSDEVVDGVLLKKPRMNMGAPLGQA